MVCVSKCLPCSLHEKHVNWVVCLHVDIALWAQIPLFSHVSLTYIESQEGSKTNRTCEHRKEICSLYILRHYAMNPGPCTAIWRRYVEAAPFLGVEIILEFLEELQVSQQEYLDDSNFWICTMNSLTFLLVGFKWTFFSV